MTIYPVKLVNCIRFPQSADREGTRQRLRSETHASQPALQRAGALRFTQSFMAMPELVEALREDRGHAEPFDLIEEVELDGIGAAAAVIDQLANGRAGMIDFTRSSAFIGQDLVMFDKGGWQQSTGPVSRLILGMVPAVGMTVRDMDEYWIGPHGTLAAKILGGELKARRYIQVHRIFEGEPPNIAALGSGQPYYGLATGWWSGFDEMTEAMSSAEGQLANIALKADEERFVDLGNCAGAFVADEPLF